MQAAVAAAAEAAGTCARCVARIVDGRSWMSSPRLLSSSSPQPPTCAVCLGLLSVTEDPGMMERITHAIKTEDYDGRTFNLSVNVPASTTVRQHAMLAHLAPSRPAASVDVKEALKALLVPRLEQAMDKVQDSHSPLQLQLQFEHAESAKETEFLVDLANPPGLRKKEQRRGITTVVDTLSTMDAATLRKHVPRTPVAPREAYTLDIKVAREPVYVAGRYNKYVRSLSQTAWAIKTNAPSLHERIGSHVAKAFRADETVLQSSGREDIDVRMLGSGRPFILEILNPRKSVLADKELASLQLAINEDNEGVLGVRDLQLIDRIDRQVLKDGEETKQKTYRCVVWADRDLTQADADLISSQKDLVVQQATPVRVLHRRTSSIRPKTIYSMSAQLVNRRFLTLDLTTQAGTYIKEFVHGDFGRTQPNVGTLLGCKTDILQLDVVEVHLDWPPHIPNRSEPIQKAPTAD